MNIYKLSEVYSSLLACDESFFSSLEMQDLKTCDKIANYFLGQKDQITKDDLNSLEERIASDKEKKWKEGVPEGLFNKTLNPQDIFAKFHPTRFHINCLPDELVSQHILPSAAEFSPQLVSEKWNRLAIDDEVWRAIADRIGCPPLKAKPGKLHLAVKEYVRNYKTLIEKLPEVTDDIKELFKREMSVEKILEVKKMEKCVRDLRNLKEAGAATKLELPSTMTRLIEQAESFAKWLDDNQVQLRSLLADNQPLPPEIVQLTSLREPNLDSNQLSSLSNEVKALKLQRVNVKE